MFPSLAKRLSFFFRFRSQSFLSRHSSPPNSESKPCSISISLLLFCKVTNTLPQQPWISTLLKLVVLTQPCGGVSTPIDDVTPATIAPPQENVTHASPFGPEVLHQVFKHLDLSDLQQASGVNCEWRGEAQRQKNRNLTLFTKEQAQAFLGNLKPRTPKTKNQWRAKKLLGIIASGTLDHDGLVNFLYGLLSTEFTTF